jgi:hypothetical protein
MITWGYLYDTSVISPAELRLKKVKFEAWKKLSVVFEVLGHTNENFAKDLVTGQAISFMGGKMLTYNDDSNNIGFFNNGKEEDDESADE